MRTGFIPSPSFDLVLLRRASSDAQCTIGAKCAILRLSPALRLSLRARLSKDTFNFMINNQEIGIDQDWKLEVVIKINNHRRINGTKT